MSRQKELKDRHISDIGRPPEELKRRLVVRRRITESGCWEYIGAKVQGYGSIRVRSKTHRVHVVAALLWKGPVPAESLCVCHTCDNPLCFNPDHLYFGTYKTNSRDTVSRGRSKHLFTTERVQGEHHPMAKITLAQAKEIKLELKNERRGLMAELGRKYGVTTQAICRIKSGKSWGWLCV